MAAKHEDSEQAASNNNATNVITEHSIEQQITKGTGPEDSRINISREFGQNTDKRVEGQRRNFEEMSLRCVWIISSNKNVMKGMEHLHQANE